MYRYIIIESKQNKHLDDDVITLFSEIITCSKVIKDGYQARMYFEHEVDLSFEDVILNVMSDTLSDVRAYVSHALPSENEREEDIQFINELLEGIPFAKYFYMDDKVLVKHYMYHLSDMMKRRFLRKFYQDQIMLETLKTYLDSNLNMVLAAKKLYIHRNTLIQRLDKFHQTTGFDVRVFGDALLVYHLIN